MVVTPRKTTKKVASPPKQTKTRSATKPDVLKPSKPHWSDQPPSQPKGIVDDVMRRHQWEPINVVDFKHEAMKCAHLILDLAGGSHPQWFDYKNYPREYRKRGNLMF